MNVTASPYVDLRTQIAGKPHTFVTYDGDTLHGTLDVTDNGAAVVRFEDGRWAFVHVDYDG